MYGPPPFRKAPSDNIEKPKSLKEYPKYLKTLIGNFFSRYYFIFKLVWETNPFYLFAMALVAICSGIFPIIGAYVTAELLQSIADAYRLAMEYKDIMVAVDLINKVSSEVNVFLWIGIQLAYSIAVSLLNSLNSTVVSISGEKVANHIKTKVITKSKDMI